MDWGRAVRVDRRTVIAGTGIALSTSLAGCLSGTSPLNGGESDGDGPEDGEPVEFETFQVGAFRANSSPLPADSTASLDAFTSAAEVYAELPLDDVDANLRYDDLAADQDGTVEDFVDGVTFDEDALLAIVAEWPKSIPSGIDVRELERAGDTLTGTAAAVADDAGMGDDAPSYPLALVAVTVGSERPDAVELTVTDGSGTEEPTTAELSTSLIGW